jgi:hypothetical protein
VKKSEKKKNNSFRKESSLMKVLKRNLALAGVSLALALALVSDVAPADAGTATEASKIATTSAAPAVTAAVSALPQAASVLVQTTKKNPLDHFTDGQTIVLLSAKNAQLRPIKNEDGTLSREDKKDIPLNHRAYQFKVTRKGDQIGLMSSKSGTAFQRKANGSLGFGKISLVSEGGVTLFFTPEFSSGPYSIASLKTDDGQYLSIGDDNNAMLTKEKTDGSKFRLVRLDDKVRSKIKELAKKIVKPTDVKPADTKPAEIKPADTKPAEAPVERKPELVAAAVAEAAKVAGSSEFTYHPILNRNLTFSESWKFPVEGSGSVVFDARAKRRLAIAFSPVAKQLSSGMYHVTIGKDFNTKTVIGHTKKYDIIDREFSYESAPFVVDVKKNGDPKALLSGGEPADGQEWGSYWIQVDQGTVWYGRGRELGKSIIGKFVDSNPLKFVKYVGFGGGAVKVEIKNIEIKGAVKIDESAASAEVTTPAATPSTTPAAPSTTTPAATPASTDAKPAISVPTGFEEEGFKGSDMSVGVRVRDGQPEHVFYALKDGVLFYRQPGTMSKDPWVKQDMPAGVTFKHIKMTDSGLTALSTDGRIFTFEEPVIAPVVPLAKLGEVEAKPVDKAAVLSVPGAEAKPAVDAAVAPAKKVVTKKTKTVTKRAPKKSAPKKSAAKKSAPKKAVAKKAASKSGKRSVSKRPVKTKKVVTTTETTTAPAVEKKPVEPTAPVAAVSASEAKPAPETVKPAEKPSAVPA